MKDSPWGVFSIGMTIPIALLVGFWMFKFRPGKIVEARVIGVSLVLAAVNLWGTKSPAPAGPLL